MVAGFGNPGSVKAPYETIQQERHMLHPLMTMTKSYMLEQMSMTFALFYGADTKVGYKVRALPKQTIARLYEVMYLNRNDPLAEQVSILESHISNHI
jgi:uncharacterized protein YbaP (TraB family)